MFENKVGRPSNETIKKRRIFKISMFLLIILVIASVIGVITYARYITQGTSSNSVDVAKWNISWDNAGTAKATVPLTITPVSDNYVASGKVAPTSLFDATYVINPGDSEVSVETSFLYNTSSTIIIGTTNVPVTLVSGSYTIDGDTTNLTLTTSNVDEMISDVNSTNITYKYPTSPIVIPLSKIKSGDGLTTVTLRFSIDDANIAQSIASGGSTSFDGLLRVFAVQKIGNTTLGNIGNIIKTTVTSQNNGD